MIERRLSAAADIALGRAARDLIDGISHARRTELLDQIRGQGADLVATLFAPHSIADLTLIARQNEETIATVDLPTAVELVGACCFIESACDATVALGRYLRDATIDLEAQRLVARSRGNHALAANIHREVEAAEALTEGALRGASAYTLPGSRAGLVRTWILARADL
jgi:hypothetical protein